ncbi:MAG: sulfite exporter TauE/SafE family protein [Sphingomicrobium sp.]
MAKPPIITILLGAMIALACVLLAAMIVRVRRSGEPFRPAPEVIAVTAVINFFDTLGIGAFAPTTAYLKLRRLTPDHLIPATLMLSLALSASLQATIFVRIIEVDPALLISCIAAAVVGAVVGSKLAERLPPARLRLVMGIGLLIAAAVMTLGNIDLLPTGGDAVALPPLQFAIAVAACLLFGSLMNVGIGFYAPALITMSLLGLDPRAAFPIMMGSCAFLMPSAAFRLLKRRELDMRIVTATNLGAIPGVLLAAFVVKSLPLDALRWVVIAVVLYAAIMMLRARNAAPATPALEAEPAA